MPENAPPRFFFPRLPSLPSLLFSTFSSASLSLLSLLSSPSPSVFSCPSLASAVPASESAAPSDSVASPSSIASPSLGSDNVASLVDRSHQTTVSTKFFSTPTCESRSVKILTRMQNCTSPSGMAPDLDCFHRMSTSMICIFELVPGSIFSSMSEMTMRRPVYRFASSHLSPVNIFNRALRKKLTSFEMRYDSRMDGRPSLRGSGVALSPDTSSRYHRLKASSNPAAGVAMLSSITSNVDAIMIAAVTGMGLGDGAERIVDGLGMVFVMLLSVSVVAVGTCCDVKRCEAT
mmetsp:Transcript_19269/g.53579  ORF Transcript_19269/g.53579 Transcript_19269/m.53579 type:complete len:290 (+) Transcript_19269:178-1047(+)